MTKTEAIAIVKSLDKEKLDRERELAVLEATLTSQNVGMADPLVDRDGFPRADIDVWNVRQVRAQIVRLRNDYQNLLTRIAKALIAVHHAPDENGTNGNVELTGHELTAFAVVNGVAPDSPASVATLKRGDRMLKFGTLTIDSLRNGLQPIGQFVELNEGKPIVILVERDCSQIELTLTPARWPGRGLLGCHILPL
ncbi:hypothetical protein SeLEV6574_g08153 [Synchytrium endobioticum]|nr:hypothetical protein SeLEV6574_g08153 [Synchytrium endobioticum]